MVATSHRWRVVMDAARVLPEEPALGGELSAREREVLAFERQWWKYAGAKEQAVRELFDMSATRYYQLLNALIDRPEALAHDPMLVKRLRRMRQTRQRARSARRLGGARGGANLRARGTLGRPGRSVHGARIGTPCRAEGAPHEQQHPPGRVRRASRRAARGQPARCAPRTDQPAGRGAAPARGRHRGGGRDRRRLRTLPQAEQRHERGRATD